MKPLQKLLFASVLFLSSYHLVRDLLQIMELSTPLADIFHRDHMWCGQYCDVVTLPLDAIGVAGSFLILRRNKIGRLGWLVLLTLPLWVFALILP